MIFSTDPDTKAQALLKNPFPAILFLIYLLFFTIPELQSLEPLQKEMDIVWRTIFFLLCIPLFKLLHPLLKHTKKISITIIRQIVEVPIVLAGIIGILGIFLVLTIDAILFTILTYEYIRGSEWLLLTALAFPPLIYLARTRMRDRS